MIVKIPLVLALCVCIKDVSSASFSKVFVQSAPEYPVDYVQYAAPSVYSQPLTQLTAAPVGSVLSSNYVPCGTPCVYPGQVASLAPTANVIQYQAPAANVVQYQAPTANIVQSPNTPVVVAPAKSEPSAYEYSYVVYDEGTGDHKIQRELSDGTVVRGGYSFLQPDGLVREVQYIADDTQGFNAIVKNYLPPTIEIKKPEPAPCPEVKKDQLIEVPEVKAEVTHEKMKSEESSVSVESDASSVEPIVPTEEHVETPKEPIVVEEEKPIEEKHEEVSVDDKPQEESVIVEEASNEETPPQETPQEEPKDVIQEKSTEVIQEPEIKLKAPENVVAEPVNENKNILVPYNDIIKCVQSAINGANEVATRKPALESPLTYIILNKPC